MTLMDRQFQEILHTTKFQTKTAMALRYIYVDAYSIYRAAQVVGLSYSAVRQAKSRFSRAIFNYQAKEGLKAGRVPAVYMVPIELKGRLDDVVLQMLEEFDNQSVA